MTRPAQLEGPVNLGNPVEFTIHQLAKEVTALIGGASRVVMAPLPADDPKQRKPDITRAREILGFEPRVPLRAGLEKTIEDFRARIAARGARAAKATSTAG